MADLDVHAVRRGGFEVVHEGGGQELPFLVVDVLLAEGDGDEVGDMAVDLAVDEHGVDEGAGVVGDDVPPEIDSSGFPVDLHDGDVNLVPIGVWALIRFFSSGGWTWGAAK